MYSTLLPLFLLLQAGYNRRQPDSDRASLHLLTVLNGKRYLCQGWLCRQLYTWTAINAQTIFYLSTLPYIVLLFLWEMKNICLNFFFAFIDIFCQDWLMLGAEAQATKLPCVCAGIRGKKLV